MSYQSKSIAHYRYNYIFDNLISVRAAVIDVKYQHILHSFL